MKCLNLTKSICQSFLINKFIGETSKGEIRMDLELTIINIINYSGEARSFCMEAIGYAKNGDIKSAKNAIEEANIKLSEAHKSQTSLIQEEARGEKKSISLLLVHAQDHLMNAITVKDMANEFIDLYKVVKEIKGEKNYA